MMDDGCWVLSAGEQENEECDGNDGNNENHKAQKTMDMMIRMKFMIKMSMIIDHHDDDSNGSETIYVSVKCVSHALSFRTSQNNEARKVETFIIHHSTWLSLGTTNQEEKKKTTFAAQSRGELPR